MARQTANQTQHMPLETRERILETAIGLFSTKGYLGSSTREIARQAGVAEVTIFRHFNSKEQLLEEVINHFSFIPAFKGILPKVIEMPYEEALHEIATLFFDVLIQLKDWVRIVQAELQRSPDKLVKVFHSFLDNLFEVLASYFRELQGRGGLRDVDPEMAARVFHGIFYCFFTVEELLEGKRIRTIDQERAIRAFVDIFANGTVSGLSAAVAGER